MRKLCAAAMFLLAGSVVTGAGAQTVIINGTSCTTGTVAFGSNQINVTATGPCTSTAAVATPTISMFTPTSALVGQNVTISGTNFAANATVTVGGVASAIVGSTTATSLTFTVPNIAAGTQNVIVTVSGVSSTPTAFTVTPAPTPTISSFSPTSATVGTSVTVTGTNYAVGTTVTVGGLAATVTNVNAPGSLTFIVPNIAAGSPNVVVTVGGQTATAAYTINASVAPIISTFTPTSAQVGASVTINGSNFVVGNAVTVGGITANVTGTTTATATTITIPNVATGNQNVIVSVGNISSAPVAFTVSVPALPAPTVSACTGAAGGVLSVTGTNFASGSTTATLNGNTLTLGTVTPTTIASTVPGAITAAGSYPLVVTVSGVSSSTFTCSISAAQAVNAGIPADIDGNLIADPSKEPGIRGVAHPGFNGGNGNTNYVGANENAWAVSPVGRCNNTTPAITRIWYHNLDFPAYKGANAIEYFGIYANEALVYSFIAPAEGTTNNFNYGESLAGNFISSFMSISTSPCDFDVAKLGAPGGYCYSTRSGQNVINYKSTTLAPTIPYCTLVPGQRYYLNWRAQNALVAPNADACEANVGTSTFCGGVLQIR